MPGLPIGPFELILVLAIALLILGPGKLPDVGAAMGRTIREFRKAATDVQEAATLEPTRPAAPHDETAVPRTDAPRPVTPPGESGPA